MYSLTLSSVIVPETYREISPRPKMTASKLLRQPRKLLKEYPGPNTLQPLHHLADVLVRTVQQKNVYRSRATLPEIIFSSCSIAICLITSRTRIAATRHRGFQALRYGGWNVRFRSLFSPPLKPIRGHRLNSGPAILYLS